MCLHDLVEPYDLSVGRDGLLRLTHLIEGFVPRALRRLQPLLPLARFGSQPLLPLARLTQRLLQLPTPIVRLRALRPLRGELRGGRGDLGLRTAEGLGQPLRLTPVLCRLLVCLVHLGRGVREMP